MATNVYKSFRDIYEIKTSNTISKRFDEPTYLTFKLQFIPSPEFNNIEDTNYDKMPHPLFQAPQGDNFDARTYYSSANYLRDSNEFSRASLLNEFRTKLFNLQSNYQWYFQKIEGIGDLLTVDPKRGRRVNEDFRLTITTLEGLDLRMSYLLNLYKKIAWDDEYQRWVLPDMMRYFRLRIFISEFRTFHGAINQNDNNEISKKERPESFWSTFSDSIKLPQIRPSQNKYIRGDYMILNVLDDVMPTWVIDCEQCEFDIEHMPFNYVTNLNVNDMPEMAAVNFKIKIGKFHEMQAYPMFRYGYLSDKLLNFLPERTREFSGKQTFDRFRGEYGEGGWVDEEFNSADERFAQGVKNIVALNQMLEYETGEPQSHISGRPFNKTHDDLKGAGDALPSHAYYDDKIDYESIKPGDPASWTGNALNFGKAFVGNYVNKTIDKLKMTPIPKLGISLTEAISGIESKDFTQIFALVRRAIREATAGEDAPSQRLDRPIKTVQDGGRRTKERVEPSIDSPIVDSTFREFLIGISQSEATDESSIKLKEAANLVLNDEGLWERIKDYSLATDLVSTQLGEENIPNPIEGKTTLEEIIKEQIGNDRSLTTILDNVGKPISNGTIFEDIPSSTATERKIQG